MGAATVSGTSLTEEFIGGDDVDKPDDSAWSSLATLFPVELSTSTVTLNPGTGAPRSATVTVWDSGVNMNVTATVTPANSEWSLAAYDCNLHPGTSCPLTLYLAPVPGGVTSATLKVTGPNGSIDVALNTTPGASHDSWDAHQGGRADVVLAGTRLVERPRVERWRRHSGLSRVLDTGRSALRHECNDVRHHPRWRSRKLSIQRCRPERPRTQRTLHPFESSDLQVMRWRQDQ